MLPGPIENELRYWSGVQTWHKADTRQYEARAVSTDIFSRGRMRRAWFAAGWNEQAPHDAVSVCALFNFMNRLVEGIDLKGNSDYFKFASERLTSDGYLGMLKMFAH